MIQVGFWARKLAQVPKLTILFIKQFQSPVHVCMRCQKTIAMAEFSQVVLEKISDISKVAQLHERLETMLEQSAAAEINASAVERIDTSTLQVLASFMTTMDKHHMDVRIVVPSASFIETVRLMGLQQSLHLNV